VLRSRLAGLRQSFLFRVAVQMGIALFVIAVLEISLGLVSADNREIIHAPDRLLFWRLKPNLQGVEQKSPESTGRILTTSISTNGMGLRDEEIPAPKPAGEYRVLVMGDSSIFGHGVQLDETFVKQLQQRLRKAYPNMTIRVVNGGVSGYSSFQGRIFYQEIAPKVQPDLVILAYYFSDFVPDVMPDRLRVAPGTAKSDLMRALSRSNLYQFLRDWMLSQKLESWGSGKEGSVARVGPEEYRDNLAALIEASPKAMLLLLDPLASPVPDNQKPYREAAHALARERRIPIVDMHEPFAKHSPRDELFLDDVHPTPKGDGIVADALFEAIQKSGGL